MKSITEILSAIPDLVAQIMLTAAVGAPNPGARTDRHLRAVPGSRPPLDLDVYDALRPDVKGQLEILNSWCIAVDEASDSELDQIPPQQPAWTTCTRYLADTWHWWRDQDWAGDTITEIRSIHRNLARINRETTELVPVCRYCRDRVDPVDQHHRPTAWETCALVLCRGCGHCYQLGTELRALAEVQPPKPLRDIAGIINIPLSTLHRWHKDGWITPETKIGREHLFDLATVQIAAKRLRHAG